MVYSWPSQGPNEIIELYNAEYVADVTYKCYSDGCEPMTDGSGEYSSLENCESACNVSNIDEVNSESINFYPNPISKDELLNFQNFKKPFCLNIYNLQGQIIYSNKLQTKSLSIKGLLESGIYFVSRNNSMNAKLIVK